MNAGQQADAGAAKTVALAYLEQLRGDSKRAIPVRGGATTPDSLDPADRALQTRILMGRARWRAFKKNRRNCRLLQSCIGGCRRISRRTNSSARSRTACGGGFQYQ